jgi:hypothetical protein
MIPNPSVERIPYGSDCSQEVALGTDSKAFFRAHQRLGFVDMESCKLLSISETQHGFIS